MAVYKPNIPQPGDFLDDSQVDILENFQQANIVMAKNHYGFDIVTGNEGKHKKVEMPQGTAPAAASNQGVLYTKAVAGSGTELFYRRASNATANPSAETQLTGKFTNSGNGYTELGGGLLLQWGSVTTPGGSGVVTYPTTFSAPAFSILLTPRKSTPSVVSIVFQVTTTSSTTQFSYGAIGTAGSTDLYWIAIGPI